VSIYIYILWGGRRRCSKKKRCAIHKHRCNSCVLSRVSERERERERDFLFEIVNGVCTVKTAIIADSKLVCVQHLPVHFLENTQIRIKRQRKCMGGLR